jgi:hypothetical protein
MLSASAIRASANGIHDCLATGEASILSALSTPAGWSSDYPFTVVENEFDFQRRYARVNGLLQWAGLQEHDRVVIVCDTDSMYFASDLEDALVSFEMAIILNCDLSPEALSRRLRATRPDAVLLLTRTAATAIQIPECCAVAITVGAAHLLPSANRFRAFDVFTTRAVPWLGIRGASDEFYVTSAAHLDEDIESPQIYLESSSDGHLVMTLTPEESSPTILPLVRLLTPYPASLFGASAPSATTTQ